MTARWLALAGLAAVALALRWPLLSMGWSPDELALLHGDVWTKIPFDAESAVNPPLLRTLLNLAVPEPHLLWVGRLVSLAAALALLPIAWALGREVAGDERGGLFTATLWAVHPYAIVMSTQCRSYSLFCLVATWHALTLVRWVSAADRRALDRPLALSAVLLPQLHYFGVLLLLYLGVAHALRPATRGLVWRYVPAAVAVLPLAPIILGTDETRVAVPGPWMDTIVAIVSTTLTPPTSWFGLLPHLPWGPMTFGAALWTMVLGAHTVVLPWLDAPRRTVTLGALAGVAAMLTFMPFQFPRTPIGLYLLVFLAPLLGAAGSLPPRRPAQAALTAALIGLFAPSLWASLQLTGFPEDGARWFAERWRDFDPSRRGRAIALYPGYGVILTQYYFTGEHRMVRDGFDPGCADNRCFNHDGVVFRDARPPESDVLLVVYGFFDLAEATAGCEVLHQQMGLIVADCPPVAP